ncbi:MAG: DUF222 domain-containing protein, partial [Propionibacteriaceae bacterium]|nr:DUF222 domain-containing protein [Propionibacteriaceae bacterium]
MATPALVSPLRPATASLGTEAALSAIAGVLDRVDHDGRKGLTGADRLELVRQARALASRVEALAVTLVAEADAHAASMATTGTPTTSWLTLDRPTTAKEAAGLVFAGVDTTRYESVKDAALAGEVAVSQARAIAKSMGELPATLTDGQRDQAVGLFLQRGAGLPAGRIKKLAPAILAEVAPEAVPSVGEQLDGLDAQRARAFRRRGLSFTPDGDGS